MLFSIIQTEYFVVIKRRSFCSFYNILYRSVLFAGWEVRIVKNGDRGLACMKMLSRPQAEGSIFKPEVTVFY